MPNAEVVRETTFGLWVRVYGREVWVARNLLQGRDLDHVGDRGTLVVPRYLAADLGLLGR